jgi:hypothetical protein
MMKFVTIFVYGIIKNQHIMYRTRLSRNYKGEPRIEVTNRQNVLSRVTMSTHTLKQF